jgi:uncharacterized protein YjiS (DUF1127 family)
MVTISEKSSAIFDTIGTIQETAMRDYAGFRGLQQDSGVIFPKLRRMVRNWLTRRHFRELDRLDDFILRDIGLRRADVEFVKSLPLDLDPIPELIHRRSAAARSADAKRH